jgi:SAM-dependent methyltransferase
LIRALLRIVVPDRVKRSIDHVLYVVRFYRSLGGVVPRECPICDFKGLFRAFGQPPRYDAVCPKCGSKERHRLIRLALQQHHIREDAEIIHFAPEASVALILPKKNYRSAELEPGKADLALDLCRIALPDQSVDVVMVNHVLEHVDDDNQALSEIFRILRPGGLLITTVPIIDGWVDTYEDKSVTRASDRELHFGQWDHVRYYGRDFRARVMGAGFHLSEFTGSGSDCVRYGLLPGESVFLGTKP